MDLPDTVTDPDELLRLAAEHLGAQTGTVHLLGDDGQLHLHAALGELPPPVLAAIATIPVGKGIAGLTVQRAEPVDLCNLQTDTSGAARPGAKATGVGGSICVPIMSGGRAVGAVGVGTLAEHEFTTAEIADLSAAAQTIGARIGV